MQKTLLRLAFEVQFRCGLGAVAPSRQHWMLRCAASQGRFHSAPGPFRSSRSILDVMSGLIAHRGPDGSGFWEADDGRCGLAHRRLAIIDLSAFGPSADDRAERLGA